MSRNLNEVLGDSVRGLVSAQEHLDTWAADNDRWDREGLPPVALAYVASRLVITAPVRALTPGGANGPVLIPEPRRSPSSRATTTAPTAPAVISVVVGLRPHQKESQEEDVRPVDRIGTRSARQ